MEKQFKLLEESGVKLENYDKIVITKKVIKLCGQHAKIDVADLKKRNFAEVNEGSNMTLRSTTKKYNGIVIVLY